MSLEDAITANTAATEAMTEALLAHTAAMADMAGKPAGKAAGKPAGKAAGKPAGKAAGKAKAATAEDVRDVFGPYLAGAADKAEKALLIATVKPLMEHFGVAKITEVSEEDRAKAIEYGNDLVQGFADDGVAGAQAVRFEFMQDDEGGDDEDPL